MRRLFAGGFTHSMGSQHWAGNVVFGGTEMFPCKESAAFDLPSPLPRPFLILWY